MLPITFPGSCFPVAPVSRGVQLSPSVISREEGQPGKCPSLSPSVLRFPMGAPCAGSQDRRKTGSTSLCVFHFLIIPH